MQSKGSTPRTVPAGASQTEPKPGLRPACDGQQSLFAGTFHGFREMLYEAARKGAEAAYDKQHIFAEDCGMSSGDLSLRLRHAEDAKGHVKLATLDMVATLATQRGGVGLDVFIEELATARGLKLVPILPPTADEIADAALARLSDKAKRDMERENGWQPGAVDKRGRR